ncbi:MAG: phosphohydrolase [Desulfobacca sp.]|nr:phosphohydrolase [Desulfobacca sp.]
MIRRPTFFPPHQWESILKRVHHEMDASLNSHGWDHVKRVYDLCLKIGKKEKGNLMIVSLAALLHDIGRKEEQASKGKICHAQVGAQKAEKILSQIGVPEETKREVLQCIRSHRFRGKQFPGTLEARILFDADKLDSIGAVGIGRAFLFAGEVGARLHNSHRDLSKTVSYSREDTAYREFQVKLIKVKERMVTPSGKALAESRHRFMIRFFKRLEAEISGLK